MDGGLQQLIQTGAIGAVLAFVLIRLESKLGDNTKAINDLTLKIGLLLDRNQRTLESVANKIDQSHPN